MKPDAYKIAVTSLLFGLILFLSALGTYNYLDLESVLYLPSNLRSIPILKNVFDIAANDFSVFRARELSYFFNILDAHLVRLSWRAGFPHYLSLTHLALALIIATANLLLSMRFLRLSWIHGLLLSLLFLTSSPIFLTSFFYRTSKILTAAFVYWLGWIVYDAYRKTNGEYGWKQWAGVGVLALALVFVDEQGVFYTACLVPVVFGLWLIKKDRRMLHLAALFAFVLVTYFLYRFWWGPKLVALISGASLDVPTQTFYALGPRSFFPSRALVFGGYKVTRDWFSFFFGSFPQLGAVGLATLLLATWPKRKDQRSISSWIPLALGVGLVLLFYFCNGVMAKRHLPLIFPFVVRVYYGVPAMAVFLLLASLALQTLLARFPTRKAWATAFLLICVTGNLWNLPEHRRLRETGFREWTGKEYRAAGDRVRECVFSKTHPIGNSMREGEKESCLLLKGKGPNSLESGPSQFHPDS